MLRLSSAREQQYVYMHSVPQQITRTPSFFTFMQEASLKHLEAQIKSINNYPQLGHGDAHAHEDDSVPVCDALAAVCTANAKLRYQLALLQKVN